MRKLLFLGLGIGVVMFLSPLFLSAQERLVPCFAGENQQNQPVCNFCHLFQLLVNIINFFLFPTSLNQGFAIVPIIATFLLVIGGFFFLTGGATLADILQAGTAPEGVKRGKEIITAVVVGLIIVYGSWLFINLVLQFLGVAQWTGIYNWWKINCAIPP